jgi:ADP-dependent NAD(P)H-hydrate dehydratase / NAD(P)H-hydrate epimerase
MKALSVAQMREADHRAIQGLEIPSEVLMDKAGNAVFKHIPSGPVCIVCGKGNNGGDGFVIARYCFLAGYDTKVIVLAEDQNLSPDARTFKRVFENLGGVCMQVTDESHWFFAIESLSENVSMVDAVVGTSTQGDIKGLLKTIIETWPKVFTIAVDIPSGLNADSGIISGVAIKATITITFQWPKTGFLKETAHPFLGEVIVEDIGIPSICANDTAWKALHLD